MPLRKNLNVRYPKPEKKKQWPKFLIAFCFALLFFAGYKFATRKPVEGEKTVVQEVAETLSSATKVKEEKLPDPAPLLADIEAYLEEEPGEYGYAISEIKTGRTFGNRENNVYTAASTVKVAIAAYLYGQIEAGKINPETTLVYKSSDYEAGTGSLQAYPVGSKFKISFLVERMIKVSDNVATNMLIRHLGRSNIQAFLNKNGLTKINMMKNQVTPGVMAELLLKIENGKIISTVSRDKLIGLMVGSLESDNRIAGGVPSGVRVAHKLGTQVAAISDVAVVYLEDAPYILTVYSKGVVGEVHPKEVIKEISKKVYSFEAKR